MSPTTMPAAEPCDAVVSGGTPIAGAAEGENVRPQSQ